MNTTTTGQSNKTIHLGDDCPKCGRPFRKSLKTGRLKCGCPTNFQDFKEELLSDPKVKAEYDALEPEYQAIRRKIQKRIKRNGQVAS